MTTKICRILLVFSVCCLSTSMASNQMRNVRLSVSLCYTILGEIYFPIQPPAILQSNPTREEISTHLFQRFQQARTGMQGSDERKQAEDDSVREVIYFVWPHILRYTPQHDPNSTLDAIQEGLLSLFQTQTSITNTSFLAYVQRVVTNRMIDQIRANEGTIVSGTQSGVRDPNPTVLENLISQEPGPVETSMFGPSETQAWFREMARGLPSSHIDTAYERLIEGRSPVEIAAEREISEREVRRRVESVRNQIAERVFDD